MKKLLLLLLVTLCSFNSYAQELFHRTIITNEISTNDMYWNDYQNKWVFIDNHDKKSHLSSWEFSFNDNGGSIISGTIFYTIKKWYSTQTNEGIDILYITAYNHKLGRDIDIIVGAPDGSVFLAFYDYQGQTAYYFW